MSSRIVSLPGVLRPLFVLATPVLLEQVLNAMVGFVDTWLTGHFVPGEAPMAAIGIMAYVMWMLPSLFAALAIGATAMVSRFIGANEIEDARVVTHQSLSCGAVVAVVSMVALFWLDDWFVSALKMEGEVAELGRTYLAYLIPVIPAIMVIQVGVACLRGAGDTVSGLIAMTGMNLFNVVVGVLLVTGAGPFPKLGWEGLAIGTSGGQVVGAVIVLFWLSRGRAGLKLRWGQFVPNRSIIGRLIRVGLPGGADIAAILFCHLWFVRIINGLGTLAASAHMLTVRVESIAYLPAAAFQVAAATMAGQFLGANDAQRASRGILAACTTGVLLLTVTGVFFHVAAIQLTAFFTGSVDNPTAVEAVPLLQLVAWAMPALAISMILGGALRGAGDTRWPFYITLIGFLGVRIPLAMYVAENSIDLGFFQIPQGVYGAWCVMIGDLFLRTLLLMGRFWQGGWRSAKV